MECLPFGSLIKVRKGELWVKDVGQSEVLLGIPLGNKLGTQRIWVTPLRIEREHIGNVMGTQE
jgi:hypothetical protein